MNNIKKALSVLLVIAMLVTACVSVSVTSKADDEVAYAFSSAKWDWWGCSQGDAGQNNSALTRNYAEGYLTYDVSGSNFKQIQDKWKTMPAGDFYINFTNNTSQSVEVKIEASVKLFDVWVPAGATQKIEFTNPSASNFSIFVMNWNTSIPVGTGLFTFSPIYHQPTVEGVYKWNLYSNKFSINSGATLAGGFNTQYSSAGTYFVSLDNAVGATATLTSLSTVKAGVYSAKLYARTTGNRANIDVFINETKVATNLYTGQNGSNSMDYGFQLSNIEILAEDQPITLTITVTDTSKSGNLYLNSLELTKMSEETTVETTNPTGNEILYKFSSANHNYSKTEGCNPNNSWAWGTFATNTLTHNSDGSVVVNTTAGDYDKFRQFNSNWNNVPAITDTAYIDITNNSTRTLKVKIVTSGYSTPADSELPTVAAGNTITLELGALAGGTIQVMLQESGGADQIECKDEIFVFSGIYKKAEETKFKVTLDGTEVGKYSDGETYTLPVNPSSSFVGFTDGANLYYMGEEITVDSNIDLTSLDLGLKMESGASIRYSTPTGLRFYTGINKDVLTKLEELGASVKLGTLISTSDLIGEETFDLNMTKQFVQIPYNSRNWFKENDFSGFVGSIVSIKTANLNRNFVGRGYAEISCGEFYKEIYADYYDSDMYNNSRSICYVAKMIKESETYASLNESQKTIIDDFVSSYID